MQAPSGTKATAAAVLFFCTGFVLSGQETRPEQTPAFRSGIELVTVDAGVVDRQGNPVRGLVATDFMVTVGGQLRRVVTAEFVDVAGSQPDREAGPDVVPVSTNEGAGIGRLVVFVVDQSTLELGSARQVTRASSRFFARLTFADRSSLMLLPVGQGVGFTWAHDRVQAAMQRVSGLGTPIFNWEFGSLSEARDIANSNMAALRTVGQRECRSSLSASGGGLATPGPATGGQTGPTPAPTPQPGGDAPPAGGETGGTGTTPQTPQPSGGTRAPRESPTTGMFGVDSCTRDIQMQAESAWRMAQMTSLASLTSLRQILAALGRVRGDKTVILISGGWPMDEREETSLMTTVAAEAAAARATLHTVFVPGSMFSADRRVLTSAPSRDQYLHVGPLETLAGMTGGGTFRAEVSADAAFDRLGREMAGYYRLGVEKAPGDLDAKNRRMKVQVSRSGTIVRAREIFDVRTYEDRDWSARLASALEAPIPTAGVGLRVTSYLSADPDDPARIKVLLTGEASRVQPGETTFQVLVRDMDGKKVLSGEQPFGEATADGFPFSTNLSVPPGTYVVRVAVIDGAGRVGSVEHRVDARFVTLGALSATGPLLIRVPGDPEAQARLSLDGVRQDERLAFEVNLEGNSGSLPVPDVVFEVAATPEGPALVHSAASLSRGAREGSVVAQAVADVRVLPPGQYVARAKVTSRGGPPGEVRRAFTVLGAPARAAAAGVPATIVGRVAPAPLTARAVVARMPFTLDQVLAPQVRGVFLDRVASRPDAASPAMQALLERARTAGPGELVVPDVGGLEAPVVLFLRGLTLLAEKKLDPAANAFRSAMRASSDFYPAMVYLGACYAAGGNDKDAAGAWRTALIKEGDAVELHVLLADALLRQDRGDLALQAVDGALARWPDDDGLKRRFVTASLLAGKYAEGLRAVDELIAEREQDEPSLALALLVLYEAFVNGRPVEGIEPDRVRMIRLAEAYRAEGGPSLALVDTWVAAAAPPRR